MKKILIVVNRNRFYKHFLDYQISVFKELGYIVYGIGDSDSIDLPNMLDGFYNINIKRNPLNPLNIIAYRHLNKILEENKFDFVYTHTPVGGLLGRLANIRFRKTSKTIYFCHGFHFSPQTSILNWLIYFPIEYILSYITYGIYTINLYDFNILKDFKFKNKKSFLTHGVGIDASRLNIISKNICLKRINLDINNDDFVVTYIAEYSKDKNHIFLINKLAKLNTAYKNIKLILLGDGKYNKYLTEYVNRKHYGNFVYLPGYTRDINLFLSITNLYVSVSKREGMGINILEAMYMRCPVLVSNIRGHDNIVDTEYRFNFNDNSFEEKFISLYTNNKLRKKLGEANHTKSIPYTKENVTVEFKKFHQTLEDAQ